MSIGEFLAPLEATKYIARTKTNAAYETSMIATTGSSSSYLKSTYSHWCA